jgi:hypothetical protein
MVESARVRNEHTRRVMLKEVAGKSRGFGPHERGRLATLLELISDLPFPIRTAADILRHFDQKRTPLAIGSRAVWFVRLIRSIPPYYFPVFSMEDLVTKAAYLLKRRGGSPGKSVRLGHSSVQSSLESLRVQLPPIKFPVFTKAELIEATRTNEPYRLGRTTATASQIVDRIPNDAFPIQSVNDLLLLAESLLGGNYPRRTVRLSPTERSNDSSRVPFKPGSGKEPTTGT